MRALGALIAIAGALLLAGCGGGDGGAATTTESKTAPPGTLEALWRSGKPAIGATPGTSDHGIGENRISFLIVDNQSRLIEAPQATLWLARDLKGKPYAKTVAKLVTIGVPGGDAAEVQHFYVAHVRLPGPGKVWYLAAPQGSTVRALGNVLVKKHADAPEIGDRAIPSATPTIASTKGDMKLLSTARKPDRALYETSVKQAMAAHRPFVVTFATPLYCQTRLCGPVVDVVGAVQKQFAKTNVAFIHAEVYKDNDPANDVNTWMTQWNLPTEPWTFVVDAKGIVRARFENAMSTAELVAAIRRVAS